MPQLIFFMIFSIASSSTKECVTKMPKNMMRRFYRPPFYVTTFRRYATYARDRAPIRSRRLPRHHAVADHTADRA